MITTLYTGQQLSNNMDRSAGILPVHLNDMGLYFDFTGIDVSLNQITIDNPIPDTGSIVAKVDLLFYNRVSITGEVLSSIVWSNYPQSVNNIDKFQYSPKLLYKNTTFEKSIIIPSNATNFKMFNTANDISLNVPMGDTNIFLNAVVSLPVAGLPSVVISKDSIATDGWYSLMSIGVCDQFVDHAFIKKGFICQDGAFTQGGTFPHLGIVYIALQDNADPGFLYDTTKWCPVNKWNTTYSVADVINNYQAYNPWVRQDFFWMAQYNKVYRDTVIDYVSTTNNFGSAYVNVKALQTSIDYYAKQGKYAEAQFILQGTDYFRTTHNFLK